MTSARPRRPRRAAWRVGWMAVVAVCALAAVAGSAAGPISGLRGASAASSGTPTVWLCRPGLPDNPCTRSLTATVVSRTGARSVQRTAVAKNPPVDCFYVYPTVSNQSTVNANLRIDPEERAVAREQASRFSSVCRVYAPMYPQLTQTALRTGQINPRTTAVAYRGLLAAWNDYLARFNAGRGVVLIGHSQGAALLIGLLKRQVDTNPAERHLLVSALLMGGNVLVPTGKSVGGDFATIPACQADSQTGCVVAYSTFSTRPSPTSSFGRPATSINGNDGFEPASTSGLQVLCTNPAALAGGPGILVPYFRQGSGRIPWVTYPNLYRSQCQSAGGATWLQVTSLAGPSDRRPVVEQSSGPGWGLHPYDVALAYGNLVQIVAAQSAAYAAAAAATTTPAA